MKKGKEEKTRAGSSALQQKRSRLPFPVCKFRPRWSQSSSEDICGGPATTTTQTEEPEIPIVPVQEELLVIRANVVDADAEEARIHRLAEQEAQRIVSARLREVEQATVVLRSSDDEDDNNNLPTTPQDTTSDQQRKKRRILVIITWVAVAFFVVSVIVGIVLNETHYNNKDAPPPSTTTAPDAPTAANPVNDGGANFHTEDCVGCIEIGMNWCSQVTDEGWCFFSGENHFVCDTVDAFVTEVGNCPPHSTTSSSTTTGAPPTSAPFTNKPMSPFLHNDHCENSQELDMTLLETVGEIRELGTVNRATEDPDAPACPYEIWDYPGVWYSITDRYQGPIQIDLCGMNYGEGPISVYWGSCDNLNCIGGQDVYCDDETAFVVTLDGRASDYYIRVYPYFNTAFELVVKAA